jgi:hypothetical protein
MGEIIAAVQALKEQEKKLSKRTEDQDQAAIHGYYEERQTIIEELKKLEFELDFIKQDFPKIPLLEDELDHVPFYNAPDRKAFEEEEDCRRTANELNSRKVQKEKFARYNELVEQYNAIMQEAGLEDELLEMRDFKAEKQAAKAKKAQEEQALALIGNQKKPNNGNGKKPQIDNGKKPSVKKNFWSSTILENRKKALALFTLPLIMAEATYEYNTYKKNLPKNKKTMSFGTFCRKELIAQPKKYKLFTATFYTITGLNLMLTCYDWQKKRR